jgi:hypothetical protein
MTPEARAADRNRKLAIVRDRQAKLAWRKARRAAEKAQTISDLAARSQHEAQVLGEAAVQKQREAKEAWAAAKQALFNLAESMNRRRSQQPPT